jgi:hypothetical protein
MIRLFEMDLPALMDEQFLLAQYGISIMESNHLADFERYALVDLAIKKEKQKLEMIEAGAALSVS